MSATKLTPKGVATRDRIVAATADLVLARGVGGTSLDDIGAETATSKGQLFHYFPGGKTALVAAIAAFQGERAARGATAVPGFPRHLGGLGRLAPSRPRPLRLPAELGVPDQRFGPRGHRQRPRAGRRTGGVHGPMARVPTSRP